MLQHFASFYNCKLVLVFSTYITVHKGAHQEIYKNIWLYFCYFSCRAYGNNHLSSYFLLLPFQSSY